MIKNKIANYLKENCLVEKQQTSKEKFYQTVCEKVIQFVFHKEILIYLNYIYEGDLCEIRCYGHNVDEDESKRLSLPENYIFLIKIYTSEHWKKYVIEKPQDGYVERRLTRKGEKILEKNYKKFNVFRNIIKYFIIPTFLVILGALLNYFLKLY